MANPPETVKVINGNSAPRSDNSVQSTQGFNDTRHNRQRSVLFDTMLHLTTVIHTFILAFLVLILYACFSTEWSFFTWHPFLMTIGWWLLASEGILLLRKDSITSTYVNRQWKIRLHWLLQGIAVACNIAGFLVAFINKNRNNRDHFTSYHGKFGLATLVISLVTLLGGTAALYSVALRRHVKPSLNKAFHVLFGVLSYVFAIVTLLFVVYSSGWFKNRIDESEFLRVTSFVVIVVTTVWLSFTPLTNFLKKIKASFSSS